MAETRTPADLLLTCLKDLREGRVLAADRLPPLVAAVTDAELAATLRDLATGSGQAAARMEDACGDLAGPDNLWMAGMADDADRDRRTIAAGPLLDLALIGAVRKMLAADIVSLATALALARRLDRWRLGTLLADLRAAQSARDAALAAHLERITADLEGTDHG